MTDCGPADVTLGGPGEVASLQGSLASDLPTAVSPRGGRPSVKGPLNGLARLLNETFARRGDRVLWAVGPEWSDGLELPDRSFRVDPGHAPTSAGVLGKGWFPAAVSEPAGPYEDSWVVVVLSADGREDELESALAGQLRCFLTRFLLIVLEAPELAAMSGRPSRGNGSSHRFDITNLDAIAAQLRRVRRGGESDIIRISVPDPVEASARLSDKSDDGERCGPASVNDASAAVGLAELHVLPTPPLELCEREREQILREELTPFAGRWAAEYSLVGKRPVYLWRWVQYCTKLITLPCVPDHARVHAADTKFLAAMMNVLVDDVADQQGNGPLLAELLRITRDESPDSGRLRAEDRPYLEFAGRVWREFWKRVSTYPCFAPFSELLRFDLAQLFNAMLYAFLVQRRPSLLNGVEDDLYAPRTMMIQSFATLDLTCTPAFRIDELGRLREAISHAESMARIGNTLGTWQREVRQGDFNNGLFAQAISRGAVNAGDLEESDPAVIERIVREGRYEQRLLSRWTSHRERLLAGCPEVTSVDLRQVAASLTRLLLTEMGSRGLK